ncbi:MAG: hypothetical protein H6Q89_2009, partial [Myxococcaceae bacterium]|nr:hypothetical protein [Myxococcaceae bacterium]
GVTGNAAPAGLNTADLDAAIKPVIVNDRDKTYPIAQIVNASRGHPFMPARNSKSVGGIFGPWAIKLSFPWSIFAAGWVFTDGSGKGLGYLNNGWVGDLPGPALGHHYGSWANDWGDRTRVLLIKPYGPMCTIFGPLATVIGLLGKSTGSGEVQVGPFQHPGIHNGVQHSYTTFPPFYDYDSAGLGNQDDLYAVPKNMSMVSGDPRARADPWDMRGGPSSAYNFQFTAGGPGATLDQVNNRAQAATGGLQNAISAGVAYYSRPDHYDEPPNLFAPYWRSTLTRMTVDRPGPGGRGAFDANLEAMFGASGQPEAAVTFRELVGAGYKGFE